MNNDKLTRLTAIVSCALAVLLIILLAFARLPQKNEVISNAQFLAEALPQLEEENKALHTAIEALESKNGNQSYAEYISLIKAHYRLYSDWLRLKNAYEDGPSYGN